MSVGVSDLFRDLIVISGWVAVSYFLVQNTFYALLLGSAAVQLRRHVRLTWRENRRRVLGSDLAPTISILAPAYNEGSTVVECVRSLLTLRYPRLQVVLVNDGSQDRTMDALQQEFDLVAVHPVFRKSIETAPIHALYHSKRQPALVVVDKENGGKADALNAGLNLASGELVCAIDTDTLIEADALLRMVRPFLMQRGVVAAGGTIRVANGSLVRGGRVVLPRAPRRALPGIQAVEYMRAFLFGRLGWNRLGGNLIISGAFGLFRRTAVLSGGGYAYDTVGEDIELVARLRRTSLERNAENRVEFVPETVAWTEVPESLEVLGRQRDRWHRGLAEVLWRNRTVVFRPRYGTLGTVVLPYFFLFELMAPVVEAMGLVVVIAALPAGSISVPIALLFIMVAYGYGLVLAALALLLEEINFPRYRTLRDRALMLLWAVVENLGYRQLTVYWRLRGLVKFVRKRGDWGAMTRHGFGLTHHQDRP